MTPHVHVFVEGRDRCSTCGASTDGETYDARTVLGMDETTTTTDPFMPADEQVRRLLAASTPVDEIPHADLTTEDIHDLLDAIDDRGKYATDPDPCRCGALIGAELAEKVTGRLEAIERRLAALEGGDDDGPCSCGGRRWVDDQNWEPMYGVRNQERLEHDGLNPCGFCNFAGWNTPQWSTA